jgi:Xaa-Pro aminopeptidase
MSYAQGTHTNHERLKEKIRQYELDAVVAISQPNLTYTSGFYNFDMTLLPFERLHATVTDADGRVTFVHPRREEPVETFVDDVVVYDASGENGTDVLAETITRRGLGAGRLGIEVAAIPSAVANALEERLPDVTWAPADRLFNEVRIVKTPAEVTLLREAAIATERAILAAYSMARPGDTEKQVVDLMGYAVTRNGADFVAFNVFASGPRTTMGHHLAEHVPLEQGAIVRVDYGASFGGYYSDLVRMAVVGQPSDRQRAIYRRVVELQREMIDLCRPGKTLRELWEMTSAGHLRRDMPMTRSMFGHSIGLSVHEPPIFDARHDDTLEAGMVVCVEHGWTDRSHAERYHIENEVLITENGPVVLDDTTAIDEMLVIV